ncbi:MAG: hypothetical protein RDV41_08420, partial [Planctomycetota bacterium]|nr:hypothetical protein [Planctomycetota bacterium]
MGGPGRGKGGRAEFGDEGDFGYEDTKIRGRVGKGEIIGSYLMRGTPLKGEAKVEFDKIVDSYAREAADALSFEDIPHGYRKYVQ